MKTRIIITLVLSLSFLIGCGSHPTTPLLTPVPTSGPVIDSLSNQTLSIMNYYKIFGHGFGDYTNGKLFLNGKETAMGGWLDTLISFDVPTGTRSGTLWITSSGAKSNEYPYKVSEIPYIINYTKNTCKLFLSDTVNIIGDFWSKVDNNRKIEFVYWSTLGNKYTVVLNPVQWKDTVVSAVLPKIETLTSPAFNQFQIILSGTQSGANRSSSIDIFLEPMPVLSSVPDFISEIGMITSVNVNYAGMCDAQIFFNNKPVAANSSNKTNYTFTITPDMVSGDVMAIVDNRIQTNKIPLTIVQNPVIDSIRPLNGTTGDKITIYGKNFGALQSSSSIYIPDFSLTQLYDVDSWSDTKIVFTITPNFASGNITVARNNLLTSNPFYYQLKMNPTLNELKSFTNITMALSDGSTYANITFDGDTIKTGNYGCFMFGDGIAQLAVNPSNLSITDFAMTICFGTIDNFSGSTDSYNFAGKNLKLVKATSSQYVYVSDNNTYISGGTHYWASRTHMSGGRYQDSQGNNPIQAGTSFNITVSLSK